MTTPALLDIGTRVSAMISGQLCYGEVTLYEHYTQNQTTFPVKFGAQSFMLRREDVTLLSVQPILRQPPVKTGMWVDEATMIPLPRPGEAPKYSYGHAYQVA